MTCHPGKTSAQVRVLNQIGCGNHSPVMTKATRDKLLRDGLIVELAPNIEHSFGPLRLTIRQFDMPIPVHMQWCEAMSELASAMSASGQDAEERLGAKPASAVGATSAETPNPSHRSTGE